MVLFKRTPVTYISPPPVISDNQMVWVMKCTQEVFTEYDDYIKRLDFYRTKQFTNQITGQTGLTFFDAWEAEDEDAREIKSIFPPPLRYQVCRRIHHNTTPRLDDLVTHVYRDLLHDFYPGEEVIVQIDENGDKRALGTIRDKITFSHAPTDNIINQPPVSRYFVMVNAEGGHRDMLLESKRLSRDRKHFTRNILRSYIRTVAFTDKYQGAPWQVKPELVAEFRLPASIPQHLTQEAIMRRRREEAAPRPEPNTFFAYIRGPNQQMQKQPQSSFIHQFPSQPQHQPSFRQAQLPQLHQAQFRAPAPGPANNFYGPQAQFAQPIAPQTLPPPLAPKIVPIKYPIEDLDLPTSPDPLVRPALRFLSDDVPEGAEPLADADKLGISMKTVGDLLYVWQTLNVHAEVFILDSFTFDDFIEALRYHGDVNNCELLLEIHCAVLKQLVDTDGEIKVLPEIAPEFSQEIDEPEDDDDDEEEEEEEDKSPTPEREETPPARRTRASLNRIAEKEVESEVPESSDSLPKNRASELLKEFNWIEELQARNFQDGGWQAIMVGAIRQASLNPRQKDVCEQILAHMMPADMEPELETARVQFDSLNVNLRVEALAILCRYATATHELREYIVECNTEMTRIRNEKMEQQKQRKEFIKELNSLEQRRKMEAPAHLSVSPPPTNGDVTMAGTEEPEAPADQSIADTEDEPSTNGRVLRKGKSRKRKLDEEKTPKKVETPEEKKRKEWQKLLDDIKLTRAKIDDCETAIEKYDDELRENYCQQLKPLGRDRFCYTYYWMERWGMPLGGLPTSSTAEYGYVNGRVWVQGPDELHKGLVDLTTEEDQKYKERIGMGLNERRAAEEGPVHLTDSTQWGYYDDPEDVKKLLQWLNEKGNREMRLRKELGNWQEPIIEYMQAWKSHISAVESRKVAMEDEATGIQTRKKTYTDADDTKHHCLKWRNTYALEELEHLHHEPPPKKKSRKPRRS